MNIQERQAILLDTVKLRAGPRRQERGVANKQSSMRVRMRLEVKDRGGGAALAAAVKHAQDNQSSFGALELR